MNGAAEQSSSQRTTTILRRRCFVVVVVVVVVTAGAVAGRLRRHVSSRGATVYTAAQDKPHLLTHYTILPFPPLLCHCF